MTREPLALLAAALLCSACGSVGEPLPPLLNVPGKVLDLRVNQVGSEAEMEWTWPLLTTEGAALLDVDRFEVFALDIPDGAGPPPLEAFDQMGRSIAVVSGDSLPSAGAGSRVEAKASLVDRFAKRTAFTVRGVSSQGRMSPWSDVVLRDIVAPTAPPAQPKAESAPSGVELRWPAVERASLYVVERRTGQKGDYAAIGSSEEPRFLDESAPLETPLAYRVRSQVREVNSEASPEASLTHVDAFPPPPPTGLRAVGTEEAVELTWTSVRDAGLAGYQVLRNGEPAHEGLLTAPAFRDASPVRNASNEYRVQAVDAKGNRSEPSEPITATVP